MFLQPEVSDWVASHRDDLLRAAACVEFARFMNGQRGSLDDVLAADCTFKSQTRTEVLRGAAAVAGWFGGWVDEERPRAFAELADEPESGPPCLLMSVIDTVFGRQGLGDVRSYLRISTDADGLIDAIFAISYTPSPHDCARSGVYPGLDEAALRRRREHTGPWLRRLDLIELHAFYLPTGKDSYVRQAHDVARELGLPAPVLHPFVPDDPLVARHHVDELPTLRVFCRDRQIRRIDGARSPAGLRAALEDLFGPLPPLAMDEARPDYFAEPPSEEAAVLRRIKGTFRRRFVSDAMQNQSLEEVPAPWLTHDLGEPLRAFLGAQTPGMRGGEDLPDLADGEVEILRRTLDTVHCEVRSLRARRLENGRIGLSMVGETYDYDEECELPFDEIDEPLTAYEALELFRDATPTALEPDCRVLYHSDHYPRIGELVAELLPPLPGEG